MAGRVPSLCTRVSAGKPFIEMRSAIRRKDIGCQTRSYFLDALVDTICQANYGVAVAAIKTCLVSLLKELLAAKDLPIVPWGLPRLLHQRKTRRLSSDL